MSKTELAKKIAATKKLIDKNVAALATLNAELVALVGDEGETFSTNLGQVQVTQRTDDRTTNEIATTFDVEKFLSLDIKTQTKIRGWGVVKQDRKQIKGQAPKVVVRLR